MVYKEKRRDEARAGVVCRKRIAFSHTYDTSAANATKTSLFLVESRFWCFECYWERKRRSLHVQTPLFYFYRPSNFTAARHSATSPRRLVCLLAIYLCVAFFTSDTLDRVLKATPGRS